MLKVVKLAWASFTIPLATVQWRSLSGCQWDSEAVFHFVFSQLILEHVSIIGVVTHLCRTYHAHF